MKRVFSDPDPMIVATVHGLLEREGIEVAYRNENLMGGAGDLPPGETWVEVCVVDASDVRRATLLIEQMFSRDDLPDRVCDHCKEHSPAAFEICWQCGQPFNDP